jgi:hypothetical protein
MILFYRIGEIKKFIGTDKNRNNFYGFRRCHVNISIDYTIGKDSILIFVPMIGLLLLLFGSNNIRR